MYYILALFLALFLFPIWYFGGLISFIFAMIALFIMEQIQTNYHPVEYRKLIIYMKKNNINVMTKDDLRNALDITYSEAEKIENKIYK